MIEATKKCPECGDNHFFTNKEKGEVICRACGFVVEDAMVDFGKDRMIDDADIAKKTRTGSPFDPRVADNLITEVGNRDDLRKLSSKQRNLMKRIRKKNKWTSSALQQNLTSNLSNLKLVASYLNLPKRIEIEAAEIYRKCVEKGVTMARSNENILAASVYIAAKMHATPKSLNEIAEATKIDKFVIAKTAKLIVKRLDLKLHPSNPIDFVSRFASELKLDPKIQTKAVKIIEKMQKQGLNSGKNPISLAATALYITSLIEGTKVKQIDIAKVSGITETTLRSRTKEMIQKLKIKKSDLKKTHKKK